MTEKVHPVLEELIAQELIPDQNERFYTEVNRLVGSGTNYIDAVITWCAKNDVEPETIAQAIKPIINLFAKIECDAEELHFITKRRRLPI